VLSAAGVPSWCEPGPDPGAELSAVLGGVVGVLPADAACQNVVRQAGQESAMSQARTRFADEFEPSVSS